MEPEKMTFKTIDAEGNEIECEALFTFESDETGKTYMVYTDHTKDENGSIKTYAGSYDGNFDDGLETLTLKPIETDKEWKVIETIFEELQKEAAGAKGE